MGKIQPVFGNKLVFGGVLLAMTVAMVAPTLTPLSLASPPVPAAPTPANSSSSNGTKYIAVEGPLKATTEHANTVVDGLTSPDDAIVRPANFLSVEDENKPADTPIAEIEPDSPETSSDPDGHATIDIGNTPTPDETVIPPAADINVPDTPTTATIATAPAITDPQFKDRSPLVYITVGLPTQAADIPVDMTETKARTLLPLFKDNKSLGLHLELIRRAALTMDGDEQMELLVGLQKHQQAANTDPYRMFPLGLAKLLFTDNQSGLYYLRKANDALQSPYTNLAYGLAQVGVDLRQEKASPNTLNQRKQDAMFRLTDAVTAHGQRPAPGFWPAYLQTVKLLSPLEAYTEHITSDPTMLLLPYGNSVSLAYSPAQIDTTSTAMAATETITSPTPAKACVSNAIKITDTDKQSASRTLYVQADGKGNYETVRVWPQRGTTAPNVDPTQPVAPKHYRMAISRNGTILADVETPKAPYIFEDLNDDNLPELVVRRFANNPEEPLVVYRYNGCQYQADTQISQLFH